MRILPFATKRRNPRAKQLSLIAVIAYCAASLQAGTLTFRSGAKLEGEVVEFKGKNLVVMKSSKDSKSYVLTISDLTDASQRYLARSRSRADSEKTTSARKAAGQWESDPGWQSSQKAIDKIQSDYARLDWQLLGLDEIRSAKQRKNEDASSEEKSMADLEKQMNDIRAEISKQRAQQAQIEANYKAGKMPAGNLPQGGGSMSPRGLPRYGGHR